MSKPKRLQVIKMLISGLFTALGVITLTQLTFKSVQLVNAYCTLRHIQGWGELTLLLFVSTVFAIVGIALLVLAFWLLDSAFIRLSKRGNFSC